MTHLLNFLKSQKLMMLATHDESGPWAFTVYIGADEKANIYFVSPKTSRHSQMLLKDPQVAFAMAWFNPKDANDRKGVQGRGVCKIAGLKETLIGLKLIHQNFPELKKQITPAWIKNNAWQSKVWVIKPAFIKYWDDAAYKDKESKEFRF